MRTMESQKSIVHEVRDLGELRRRHRGPLSRLAYQLQRRRVSRAVLSYAIILWLNVQIGDVVFPMAGLPDWTLRLIVVIGIMGLPLIIFLAWTFQITPRGIVVDEGSGEQVDEAPARIVEMTINAALLLLGLALATLSVAQFAFAENHISPSALTEGSKVATQRQKLVTSVSFHTASDQAISLAFVNGVEAEIRHQLIKMANVTVVAGMRSNTEQPEDATLTLLSGSLYLDEEQVHVIAQLQDLENNEFLWTMIVDLSGESMLEAEKTIAEHIAARFQLLLDGAEPVDQLVMKVVSDPSGSQPVSTDG
ncbi:MAG: hypothetical protein O7G86_14535 [Gammaproteobacteria bacterium]|nr:hypothetical protein [Gammaproteobacteria bacterium]